MPKLPSSQDITRQVPSFDRPVASVDLSIGAKSLGSVAGILDKMAVEKEESQRRIELATAQTNLQLSLASAKDSLRDDTDYATHSKRFNDSANNSLNSILKQISNPSTRELFRQDAISTINKYSSSVNDNAYKIRDDIDLSSLTTARQNWENSFSSLDRDERKALKNNIVNQASALAFRGSMPYQTLAKTKIDIDQTEAELEFSSLSPIEQLGVAKNNSLPAPKTTGNSVLDEAISMASAKHGVPADVLTRIAMRESSGRPNKINGASKGAFQFQDDAANKYSINPLDPYQAADAAARLYLDNEKEFQSKMGRKPVSDAEVYLLHQQGASGGAALLKAGNDRLAVDVLRPFHKKGVAELAITENGGSLDMTAGEFANFIMGKYDGSEYVGYYNKLPQNKRDGLIARAEKQIEEINDRNRISQAIEGNGFIDTSDSNQMRVFDDYFRDTVLPSVDGVDPYQKNAFIAKQIVNAGAVPKSIIADMVGKIRTGGDNEVIEAADLYSQLYNASPDLVSDINEKDVQMAVIVSEALASGIPAKEAIAMARSNTEVDNKPLFETRKTALKDDKVKKDIDSNAQSLFGSRIPFMGEKIDPMSRVGASIVADYRKAYESAFLNSGSEKTAKSFADRIVSGRYMKSAFNGGTLMRYAPEKFYSVPHQDNEWMLVDFEKWRAKNIPDIRPESAESYSIMPDIITAREASMVGKNGERPQPSYRVVYTNPDTGLIEETKERYRPNRKALVDGLYDDALAARGIRNKQKSPISGAYIGAKVGVIPQ